jgi:flagellar basal-body rod protein FlgF
MSGMIYKAAAGAILQQIRLEAYANNLANVNTVGFKADQPVFRFDPPEILSNAPDNTARLSPYTLPLEYATNFDAGPLRQTGGSMDVAIVGHGFFEVRTPDGSQYTRNGNLSINAEGLLSTSEGWPVMGQGGEISIDGNRMEISEEGEVIVDGDVVGILKVVDFNDPSGLKKVGNSLFKTDSTDAGLIDAKDYRIAQGALESSNVDAIRTMTEIIETLRVFETYQKVIRSADEATAKTVNEVGIPA